MKSPTIPFLLLLSCLVACGEDEPVSAGEASAQPGNAGPAADHGAATDLGTLTVAGREFEILRLGDLVPGVEGAFEVHGVGASRTELATLNVYLWVESRDGTQLSAPAKGSLEGDALHFHVTPRRGDNEPYRVVLRLRSEGVDERASLPLDGHGHEHHDGPHGGVPAAFTGGDVTGHLELKLHDDKGDLELWLSADEAQTRPFDLPLDASVRVRFPDLQGREVVLRPRDRDRNEDENGVANVRAGRTNYFIYPSAAGEDASWLRGKAFRARATVHFERDGQPYRSEELVLVPHTHGH